MTIRKTLTQHWQSKGRWKYGVLTLIALLITTGMGFLLDAPGVRQCVTSANLDQCYLLGKTLWDWLGLIGVPLSLAVLGFVLQRQQQKRTETLAKEQRERNQILAKEQRKIAADEEKEEILQTYFDRISLLLVDKNLLAIAAKAYTLKKDNEERSAELTKAIQAIQEQSLTPEEKELLAAAVDVIRARTLSILRRLKGDGTRKGSVIRFLIEAEVISKAKLSLRDANLHSADLWHANLSGTDLIGINLNAANLSYAKFIGADLSGADLIGADLFGAKLRNAKLRNVNLYKAKLERADLNASDLSRADLSDANFRWADLSGADLTDANLIAANLTDANLSGANLFLTNLSGANLSGANLSGANLKYANLINANLSCADLRGADLRDTMIFSTLLQHTDLSGADLRGTLLMWANLMNIKWNKKTIWPAPEKIAQARNIPEELKQQLGIK